MVFVLLFSLFKNFRHTAVAMSCILFALGGHSLLLARIAARIRETFDIDLSLRALFESPTVALVAQQIETARRSGSEVSAAPLASVPRDRSLPLSFA